MRTAVHRHRGRRQRLLQQEEEEEANSSGGGDRGMLSTLRQVFAAGVGTASAVAGLVSALHGLPD
jgi:hypothetical protein